MDKFKMTDYITFLTILAQVMKNLKKLKRETTSALDTINTNFDITEVVTTADPSIGLITGIISVAKSADKEKKNNEKIKNAVNSAKDKLSALDKWIDADFAQYLTNQINILLEAQGWTKAKINELLKKIGDEFTPVSSASTEYYSYQEIKKNTKTQELDVHTHGSYSSMTFNHIIFGDAAEDQTQSGTVITVGLQFVPGLDTILDVRDVVVDGYLWVKKSGDYSTSEKVELGAFTALDVVGFIPIVGVLKYSDEAADIAKSGKNISKARGTVKTMEKVKDIEHTTGNLKNIGNTADNVKDIGNVADNIKNVENGAEALKNTKKNLDDATKVAKSQADDVIKNVESRGVDLKTTKQKGNYGEMKMDQHLEDDLGYSRISKDRVTSLDDKIHHGIDGVYENASPPPKYIIAEAKYNTSQLNPKTKDGTQMSERWIKNRLQNAVGAEEAKKIRKEMILHPENVQRMLVNVKPDGTVVTKILK